MDLSCNEEIKLKKYMPNSRKMKSLTDFFYLFSDSTRLRIIILLMIKPLCVTDITTVLSINQTTVSHQLKILRAFDVVSFDRAGKNIVYYIKNKAIEQVLSAGADCI